MKIKVCGLRDIGNVEELSNSSPDYFGYIFYKKSKRYVGENFSFPQINNIKNVAVFVNEEIHTVNKIVSNNKVDIIQLHGNESVEYIKEIKASDYQFEIIKTFSVTDKLDESLLKTYTECCNYFLFDSSSHNFGGTGLKFDWNVLNNYKLEIPFFLSGGISPEDVNAILQLKKQLGNVLYGIDINSRFEIEVGLKDVDKVSNFINQIKANNEI
jgi:phosphoribosylanthranilate isomerase